METARIPEIADFYARNMMGLKNEAVSQIIAQGIESGEFHKDALSIIDGFEAILGAQGKVLMLNDLMGAEDNQAHKAKWKSIHFAMMVAFLKNPHGV